MDAIIHNPVNLTGVLMIAHISMCCLQEPLKNGCALLQAFFFFFYPSGVKADITSLIS